MNSEDFDRFKHSMQTAAAVYGHKLDDKQMQFYWDCLKDRSIDDVERRLQVHASRAKFWPKPRDLRPAENEQLEPERDLSKDSRYQDALAWNIGTWERSFRDQPALAKLRLCDALLARYQLEDNASDKIEWLKERAGAFLREADPAAVLADFSLRRLVLIFWPKNGLQRLRSLVEQKVAA